MPSTKFARSVAATLFAVSTLFAQQPNTNPPPPDAPAPPSELAEVHIDHDCRVLTPGRPTTAHPTPPPRYRYNNIVCHIESHLHSNHWEQRMINGVPKQTYVSVIEREYLLQNTTDKPVAFIVDQPIPKGWHVDSDPQPINIQDSTATFRVFAEPGQIVRLHVGQRS